VPHGAMSLFLCRGLFLLWLCQAFGGVVTPNQDALW
jgi:hypothetical protein